MRRTPLDETLLISAVRYALGRRTHIVNVTVREVLHAWPDLTDNTRATIQADVRDADHLGDPCDHAQWIRLTELETTP